MQAGSGAGHQPSRGAGEASRRRGSGAPAGKLPAVPDLVAIDLPGGPSFVAALQRAWGRGDAVLPLDQRLSATATEAVLNTLRPARVVHAGGETVRSGAVRSNPVMPLWWPRAARPAAPRASCSPTTR